MKNIDETHKLQTCAVLISSQNCLICVTAHFAYRPRKGMPRTHKKFVYLAALIIEEERGMGAISSIFKNNIGT